MERILFLGWRRDMHDIIGVLDKYVDRGSELWLYNEVSTFLWVVIALNLYTHSVLPRRKTSVTLRYAMPQILEGIYD